MSGRLLAAALEHDELTAMCGPIADLTTGAISAASVLARWPPPDRGDAADVCALLDPST